MSDTALNKIIQYGTTAARIAFVPNPASGSKVLYIWYDTDNAPNTYIWNGAAWVQINSGGGGSGSAGPQGLMGPPGQDGYSADDNLLVVVPDVKFGPDGSVYWSNASKAQWAISPTLAGILFIDGNAGAGVLAPQIKLKDVSGDYIGLGTDGNDVFSLCRTPNDGFQFYFGNGGVRRLGLQGGGSGNIRISPNATSLDLIGVENILGPGNVQLNIISDDANDGGTLGIFVKRSNRVAAGTACIMVWQYDTTEVARLTTSGRLGIGVTAPSTQLHTSGGVRFAALGAGVVNADSSGNLSVTPTVLPRTNTTASSATPSINTDTTDIFTITALAAAITSVTVTGTPVNGQKLIVRILDNGTARAIAWGASFAARGVALPTTTVASKYLYVEFIYNSTAVVWDCISFSQEV